MAGKVSIGTAWAEAAAFVREERRLLAPVVLALMVVPSVVAQLFQPAAPFAETFEARRWMLIAFAALLIGIVGQMAIARLAMGWSGSLGDVLRLALRRFFIAFLALLLFGVVLTLVSLPVLVIATLLLGTDHASSSAVAGLSLITVLLIVAAAPRVLLIPALAMDEGLGPWRLLRRTWALSSDHYWRLFGFFALFMIASFVLTIAVSAVVGSLSALLAGPPRPLTVSRLIVALAGGVVQGAVSAIYAAMIGRIVGQLLEGSTSGT